MLEVLPMVDGGEGVHLDPKRDPLLPAVLPGGELGADAVHLRRRAKSETQQRRQRSRRWNPVGTWMKTEAFF